MGDDPPRVAAMPAPTPPATPATIGIQTFGCAINMGGFTFVSAIDARITSDSGGNPPGGTVSPITTICPGNNVTCVWDVETWSDFLTTLASPCAITETFPT